MICGIKKYQLFSDSSVIRGCVTDLKQSDKNICLTNGETCKICHGDGCNHRANFSNCVHCTFDSDCEISPEKRTPVLCTKYDNKCFVHISKTDVSSGCLYDKSPLFISNCIENNKRCKICETTDDLNCTVQTIEVDRCVECDSNKDAYCNKFPELYKNRICGDLSSKEHKGCYLEQVK